MIGPGIRVPGRRVFLHRKVFLLRFASRYGYSPAQELHHGGKHEEEDHEDDENDIILDITLHESLFTTNAVW